MAHIFLDESGQFAKHNHEEYFIVASFTIGEPRRTAKEFRKWVSTRFPKRMRRQAEIKWSATGISDELRLRTLKRISNLDVRIRYVYLLRNNIPSEYRDEHKIKDGFLYTNVVGELLDMYLPNTDVDFRVFCDQRKLSGLTKADFKEAIIARMLPNLPQKAIIQIETLDSTSSENIQIADWVAGALARWHEKGPLGDECRAILKENIIGEGKELFSSTALYL